MGRRNAEVVGKPVWMTTEIGTVLPSAPGVGLTVQTAFAGAPVHANATLPFSPACDESRSGKVALVPLDTVTLVAPFAARAKSMPIPVREMLCVPEVAVSVRVRVPVRVPAAVGVKITERLQADPGPTVDPQVSAVIEKSPVTAVWERLSRTPPLLVRTRVAAGAWRPTPIAPKSTEDGVRETPAGARPRPDRATVWSRN